MYVDELLKLQVWIKGKLMLGRDPAEWRMDAYGGIMRYAVYGQTSAFGWEVDHINPKVLMICGTFSRSIG